METAADDPLRKRITELGDKATQLLTFLSFAIVAAVIVAGFPQLGYCQRVALKWALRCWVLAFVPILVSVLPVKEFVWEDDSWYGKVRKWKVVLLWVSVVLILCGVAAFLCAIW